MKHYIIKQDDTLSEISESFDVPLKVMLFANPEIADADKIKAGQVIRVPEVVK